MPAGHDERPAALSVVGSVFKGVSSGASAAAAALRARRVVLKKACGILGVVLVTVWDVIAVNCLQVRPDACRRHLRQIMIFEECVGKRGTAVVGGGMGEGALLEGRGWFAEEPS